MKQLKIMSRYEFNENPQVTMWRMKCEALEKEMADQKKECKYQKDNAEFYFNMRKEECEYYEKMIDDFNRLPWWEKIFYRFWI